MNINFSALSIAPVHPRDKQRYRTLMEEHHYLGDCPKIGHTLWYVATYESQWVALITFAASAWKCGVRDRWIGWDFRTQYGRLHLIANNSRFLILPEWHYPNLASKILSLCHKRIANDWQEHFSYPLLLLETFVDPERFHGTIYRASNWINLGLTRGFRRRHQGYTGQSSSPKHMFVYPLVKKVAAQLSAPQLNPCYQKGKLNMTISARQMKTLPDFFGAIPDPRRAQGRRHTLKSILSIAAGATLCGMRGYKAMAGWAKDLGQKARARFECRYEKGRYEVPSEYVIRDTLIRIKPDDLDNAIAEWNKIYGPQDTCLAADGKVMCNAIDKEGKQTHIMSVVGHESANCYTQKKVGKIPKKKQ